MEKWSRHFDLEDLFFFGKLVHKNTSEIELEKFVYFTDKAAKNVNCLINMVISEFQGRLRSKNKINNFSKKIYNRNF